MVERTQIREPTKWEDVAGIGPTRADRLRKDVGSYDGFKKNSSTAKKNKIASAVSGNRRNLPEFARNAIDAASQRERSPDVVDNSLVKTREVDKRSAQTRSKTKIKGRNADADRSDLGFETMESDPDTLDTAVDRFTEEYDDPFDPSPREIGEVAMDKQDPEDKATVQPLIGAATSRTVFGQRATGDDFRRELQQTAESTDRPTASPGELADAFIDFVDQSVGLNQNSSQGNVFRGPTKPTNIGRERDGEFARPESDPEITPAPVARNTRNGQFGLDPFDLSSGGTGESLELFGGDR